VALSPKTRDPLIVPGSSALEAMSSPCMAISIRVVAAVGLRAMQKGLTSHPMVEISLVHDDGSASPANAWNMGNDLKGGARTPSSASTAPSAARGSGGGHHTRPLRSPVVKSSLNPIWNFDVDFGDVDTESVVGVLFVVRHVEKLGMVKKDMGELMLSLREVMDLKMVRLPRLPSPCWVDDWANLLACVFVCRYLFSNRRTSRTSTCSRPRRWRSARWRR